MPDYIHAELTRLIIGAFFDLYNELGHGFNERVYRNALAVLLRERGTSVVVEQPVVVNFHGVRVGTFCVDLVVNGKALVEVKASRQLEPRDEAQILNCLKAAGGGSASSSTSAHRSPTVASPWAIPWRTCPT